MKICLLALGGALLLCCTAWAQDEKVVEVEATVTADTVASNGETVANIDLVADSDVDAPVPVSEVRKSSLRDEYRQWKRSTAEKPSYKYPNDPAPRSASRSDIDRDRLGSDYYARSSDRADRSYVEIDREVGDYADYPEYDDDVAADRMHDDYDRGGDRYWSRSYGDVRYWDNRGSGSSCGCNDCGEKCYKRHKPSTRGCGKCGERKCGCHQHKPKVKSCGKCGAKAQKCGCHKSPVKSCGKCQRCDAKPDKCSCKRVSKKCRNC